MCLKSCFKRRLACCCGNGYKPCRDKQALAGLRLSASLWALTEGWQKTLLHHLWGWKNKLSHFNTGMCSSRRALLSLPQSPSLCSFPELNQAKPRLGLGYHRPRHLSSSISVALRCSSLVLVCELCSWWAQRKKTREWELHTRSDTDTKPVLSSTSPKTIQLSYGQAGWAASLLLAAEIPYWSSCPAFSPQVPSSLDAAVSANLLEPSKLFSSEMIKGLCISALSQLQCLKTVSHGHMVALAEEAETEERRKNTSAFLYRNIKFDKWVFIFGFCCLHFLRCLGGVIIQLLKIPLLSMWVHFQESLSVGQTVLHQVNNYLHE